MFHLPNVARGASITASHGGVAHMHAAAMATRAAQVGRIRQALGAAPSLAGPAPVPGAAISPAAGATPPGAMPNNYKVHIASGLAQRGVRTTVGQIHNAIDGLTAKGRFTPFQGSALKQHAGPLQGPAGAKAMNDIAGEVVRQRSTLPIS